MTLNALSSWGGIRASDGTVVLSIWKDDIRSEGGHCSCLLWAPNEKGSRPWSDKPGGRERLDGHAPEDRARTVSGIDPAIVVQVGVALRGREYWAVWGARRTGVAASL